MATTTATAAYLKRLRAEAALWNAVGWALFSATCWVLRESLRGRG